MFRIFTEPPVSYIAASAIGFFIGLGVELLDIGLVTFFLLRRNIPLKSRLLMLAIALCTFGTLLAITGIFSLLVAISAIFTTKDSALYSYINVLIALIVCIIMIIPAFLRRRKAR